MAVGKKASLNTKSSQTTWPGQQYCQNFLRGERNKFLKLDEFDKKLKILNQMPPTKKTEIHSCGQNGELKVKTTLKQGISRLVELFGG
jgi:hypothetical protein